MVARWRLTELGLLGFPAVFLLIGFTLLGLVATGAEGPFGSGSSWRTAILFSVLMYGLHFFLVWRWPSADQLLLPLVAVLSAIGLLMVTRLAPSVASRQTMWI